ncbi:MAG: APC family permease [Segniliparus sp.]|uniref:APC family permease n=1 Tax=Segniliparus sp. TaxID=2804064 RepID=UPI003F309EB3
MNEEIGNARGAASGPVAPEAYVQELSRSLTARDAVLITLSAITPASSVFVIVPSVLLAAGGASVLVMLAAAGLCVAVGLCYAELAARYPIAGGEYTWAARLLGRTAGFAAFVLTMSTGLLVIAVVALGAGDYLGVAVPGLGGKWIGVAVIAATTVLALAHIRANAWVTGAFLLVEVAAIAVLTVVGFAHPARGPGEFLRATMADGAAIADARLVMVVAAIPVALFSYNGYGSAVYYAEETRDASRVIGKIVLACLAAAVVIEVAPLAAVVVGAPSMADLLHSAAPMSYVLETRAGHTASVVVSLGVAVAIINAVIALVLQMARLLFSSARDGSWPLGMDAALSRVSRRTRTPVAATLAVGGAAASIAAAVPLPWLVVATGTSLIPLYTVVAAAALLVRKQPRNGGYSMPWWPLPPLVVIAAMALIAWSAVRANWTPVAMSAGMLVLGALYYRCYLRPRLGGRWSLPEPPA